MRRGRSVKSLCGESARESMRQIKELLSSCKDQVEIRQQEFILVYSVLPVASVLGFGKQKGRKGTVEARIPEIVTLNLV